MFDRHNLTANGIGSPIHIFENHKVVVLCVHFCIIKRYSKIIFIFQWSPGKSSVFGSSAEDGVLNIWDHNKVLILSLSHKVSFITKRSKLAPVIGELSGPSTKPGCEFG
ncbi:putative transcription factor WD40-like family [Helianthus anomalus]